MPDLSNLDPAERRDHRAGSSSLALMRFLRRWFFIVDDRVGWWPFALWKALRITRHERPDWILTTSLPNTSHLVGLALKTLPPRLRWAADFRDGWTQSRHYFDPPTRLHRRINEWLERRVAAKCDLLVTVSPPLTDYFRGLPGVDAGKCHTITNGFDSEDFAALPPAPPPKPNDPFHLVYTGSFFGTRSPAALLAGMAEFLRTNPDARDNFKAIFYSQWDDEWLEEARSLGLEGAVDVRGFVDYRRGLAAQARATALLLLVPVEPHEPIMMTQKVFEYLAAGRTILCAASEGTAVVELLSETGGAVFAPPDDPAAIAGALGELWRAHRGGALDRIQAAGVERFSRAALAERLNDLLRETG